MHKCISKFCVNFYNLPYHNLHACTRFISLSYSYLDEIINVLYPYHIHNRLKQVLNGDGYGCWIDICISSDGWFC